MKKYLCLMVMLAAVLLIFAGCGGSGSAPTEEQGSGCVHGELPYEWSGEFTFSQGTYTLEFEESDDPSCAIAFMILDDEADEIAHMAIYVMEAHMDTIEPGGHFTAEPEYGYILVLNPKGTTFTFEIKEANEYLLFTEHFPHEFNLKILDSSGRELEAKNPVEYEDDHDHDH